MEKKTFLITGASKGIGYATGKILSEQGHEIIGLARTEPKTPLSGEFITIDLFDGDKLRDVLRDWYLDTTLMESLIT